MERPSAILFPSHVSIGMSFHPHIWVSICCRYEWQETKRHYVELLAASLEFNFGDNKKKKRKWRVKDKYSGEQRMRAAAVTLHQQWMTEWLSWNIYQGWMCQPRYTERLRERLVVYYTLACAYPHMPCYAIACVCVSVHTRFKWIWFYCGIEWSIFSRRKLEWNEMKELIFSFPIWFLFHWICEFCCSNCGMVFELDFNCLFGIPSIQWQREWHFSEFGVQNSLFHGHHFITD